LDSNPSIPIGAITEISPKGFTLGLKAERKSIFLIYYFMTLNCPLKAGKRIPINLTGHFATLGANVVAINFCCFDEIHYVKSKYFLNQTLYLLFFHFIS
jgi:hypothetical protein